MSPVVCKMILTTVCMSLLLLLCGCGAGSGGGVTNCDGETCGCTIQLYGGDHYWKLNGVPIENSQFKVYIPKVSKDANGTATACCIAMTANYIANIMGLDNKTTEFCDACKTTENEYMKKACNFTSTEPQVQEIHDTFERLSVNDIDYDNGTNCEFTQNGDAANVTINGVVIGNAEFTITIDWTDEQSSGETPCCSAVQPLFKEMYMEAKKNWSQLNATDTKRFSDNCRNSPNKDVQLAAWRTNNVLPQSAVV